MELHEFVPPDLQRLADETQRRAQAVFRGPVRVSIGGVLERALAAMDAEDRAELARTDPVAYARLYRPRRRLIDVLLHGKARP